MLLPIASGDSGPQNSAPADSNHDPTGGRSPIVSISRRRLTGKRGDAQTTKNRTAATLLRARPHYTAFMALSRDVQTQARKYVRTYLNRRLGMVKRGKTMRLNTGVLLHCPSPEDYEWHESHIRVCLLLDLAMNDNANPDHIGAASCRWFEETGEVSRPMKRSVDDLGPSMPIRSAQLLLTWHGDFGASEVITSGMDNVTITDLVNLVRQSPSVRTAWSSICETLLNLKQTFVLPAIAFALEICTRQWSQNKLLKLHVHGWMLQSNSKLRLTMEHL